MEWVIDPTVWLGLATLTLLEIILGMDNLVFLAIISAKVAVNRRNAARRLGLSLALIVRLLMLAAAFWMTTLTRPILFILKHSFSSRDLILLAGGLFLLLKATLEIHERLEVQPPEKDTQTGPSSFTAVVAQIVVLDAIFSLDSILTAVGMSNQLGVMMAAVIIAIGVMLFASRPLSDFVNAHPSLIMLCLGFLLMIGFSLVAEGSGIIVPKGYLYSAIAFSIVIESFNQIAMRNRRRQAGNLPRQRVKESIRRLLDSLPPAATTPGSYSAETLVPAERQMILNALSLTETNIGSIMTPRHRIAWVDLNEPQELILARLKGSAYGQIVVCNGALERVIGILRKQDLLDLCLDRNGAALHAATQSGVLIPETESILTAIELFAHSPVHAALVMDKSRTLSGIVTRTDVLRRVACGPTAEVPGPSP
jgi:predicted tellurium resistance membrane protein TerC/predicted transcriptional regulator